MTPQRTCVSCRCSAPRDELLRLVVGPDGTPAIDFSQRLPGRGAYACWRRECLSGLVRKGLLTRALRQAVELPDEDWAVHAAQRHLIRHIADTCALARRSGVLKSGAHTADMALRRGWVRMGLTSSDASTDGADRFRRKCVRAGARWFELPLTSGELGQALGKELRSVAVMGDGTLTRELERSLQRYRGLL